MYGREGTEQEDIVCVHACVGSNNQNLSFFPLFKANKQSDKTLWIPQPETLKSHFLEL